MVTAGNKLLGKSYWVASADTGLSIWGAHFYHTNLHKLFTFFFTIWITNLHEKSRVLFKSLIKDKILLLHSIVFLVILEFSVIFMSLFIN